MYGGRNYDATFPRSRPRVGLGKLSIRTRSGDRRPAGANSTRTGFPGARTAVCGPCIGTSEAGAFVRKGRQLRRKEFLFRRIPAGPSPRQSRSGPAQGKCGPEQRPIPILLPGALGEICFLPTRVGSGIRELPTARVRIMRRRSRGNAAVARCGTMLGDTPAMDATLRVLGLPVGEFPAPLGLKRA